MTVAHATRDSIAHNENVGTETVDADAKLDFTTFARDTENAGVRRPLTWPAVCKVLSDPPQCKSKKACPLMRLGKFKRDSRATGMGLESVGAIVADYDGNELPVNDAAQLLRSAGVRACIYTSATHGVRCKKNPAGGPRWRVVAPLARVIAETEHQALMDALNGALGGVLGTESWDWHRCYYFGRVEGVGYQFVEVDGAPLDLIALAPDFDPIPSTKKARPSRKIDRSVFVTDDPVVKYMQARGEVTGGSRGKVFVVCPKKDQHNPDHDVPSSTAWLLATETVPARFRCVHESHGSLGTSEFLGLVGYDAATVPDEFEVVPHDTSAEVLPAFERNATGKIKPTRGNLGMALTRSALCGLQIRHDSFREEIMIAPAGSNAWRPIKDDDYTSVCTLMENGSNGFLHIPKELIRDMVANVAGHNQFDSAQHWLSGCVWDGVPRVEAFFSKYLGAADTLYTRAVARYTWSALAGRVIEPGVKADMAPVLVGRQGAGKSTVVAAIAPSREAFLELDLSKKDDDQAREMRGVLVVELGELKGLRAKEQSALKAFISRREDVWVEKWKTHATRYLRRSIFIGTTNSQEFLDDDTGHRRWLPIEVSGHDTTDAVGIAGAAVARDREQLWAEGAAIFQKSGIEWRTAEQLARPEHSKFEVTEPWATQIESWLADDAMDGRDSPSRGDGVFATEDVLISAIGIELRNITDYHRKRVAAVLRKLGYADRREQVGKNRATRWRRIEAFV